MRIFIDLSFQISNSFEEFLVRVGYDSAGRKFWDGMIRDAVVSGSWLITALNSGMIQIYDIIV